MPLVLQVRGVVGRAGRLPAAVGLAAVAATRPSSCSPNRRKFRDMMPYAVAILMPTQGFFLLLIAFVVSPFDVLAQGKGIVRCRRRPGAESAAAVLDDGDPSAGALPRLCRVHGSVRVRDGVAGHAPPGDDWIHTTRRWSLVTWLFQSAGIMLGAGWAYAVLGWGGYWGWDPVENASLLPWLTSTAFLHSVMMQEKKGMMKVWNMVLVSATFWLCIFGTTLTRTGHRQLGPCVRAIAHRPLLLLVPGDRHRGNASI